MDPSTPSGAPPHLFDPNDLLLPALLLAQLGDGAAGHTGHAGVTGLSHEVSLLPGWQDVGAGRQLLACGDGGLHGPEGGD